MELRYLRNFPFEAVTLLLLLNQVVNASVGNDPCRFPAVFNFGDSNSDTGGLSAAFGQAGPPHGESFFHGPAGRYCDGRLVIDFIAQSFGLPYLSAYLDALGSNFTHGANFATAGSTIRPQNTTLHQSGFSPFSLNVQWYQFNDFHHRVQTFRARKDDGIFKKLMPKTKDFERALYTFDIGQNDLTAGLFQNLTVDEVRESVPDILGQFKSVIKSVYDQGGRFFWIHNTGPFGCLPYVMARQLVTAGEIDRYGCVGLFNELAQFFNHQLKEIVNQLRDELPKAAIIYVDVYSVKYELITKAKRHGFVHPLRACCGHGGKYNFNLHMGCGGKVKVNGKDILIGKACEDPNVMINWDGVHYTQAANEWVFNQIVNGSFSDPPLPLGLACYKES
uniref:alpha-L-fucosidase 3-like n=1 Tax=Erigeron canadensis TaxID=72917 RepID=UPI001CB8CD24|nr:alpha-L-fucosidase 3-like [Erigeron canadensis]